MRRRTKNLLTKLVNGIALFTNESPRISNAEIAEIERLTGVFLQRESLHGASAGPRIVYVMERDEDQFKNRCRELFAAGKEMDDVRTG